MRFRLAPRSMTLDDLELENNLFPSFRLQYLANSMHRCRPLTFASARLSCYYYYASKQDKGGAITTTTSGERL